MKNKQQAAKAVQHPIHKIYCGIIADGTYAGVTAVFVEFAGCNLACADCTVDHTQTVLMTPAEIVVAVKGSYRDGIRTVVLGGGEPTIHALEDLCTQLYQQYENTEIILRTNGTLPDEIADLYTHELVDWVTLVPGSDGVLSDVTRAMQNSSEIIVLQNQQLARDLSPNIPEFLFCNHRCFFRAVGAERQAQAIAFVSENPGWRLTVLPC